MFELIKFWLKHFRWEKLLATYKLKYQTGICYIIIITRLSKYKIDFEDVSNLHGLIHAITWFKGDLKFVGLFKLCLKVKADRDESDK